jgi:hypothetical protein
VFKLSKLVEHVQMAKNIIVLLTPDYPTRPFTLVELHFALLAGLNVVPVQVSRAGMKPFNFEQVHSDIKKGKVKKYLNKDGWAVLANHGIGLAEVEADLKKVMDVVSGLEFKVGATSKVQAAQILDISSALLHDSV